MEYVASETETETETENSRILWKSISLCSLYRFRIVYSMHSHAHNYDREYFASTQQMHNWNVIRVAFVPQVKYSWKSTTLMSIAGAGRTRGYCLSLTLSFAFCIGFQWTNEQNVHQMNFTRGNRTQRLLWIHANLMWLTSLRAFTLCALELGTYVVAITS